MANNKIDDKNINKFLNRIRPEPKSIPKSRGSEDAVSKKEDTFKVDERQAKFTPDRKAESLVNNYVARLMKGNRLPESPRAAAEYIVKKFKGKVNTDAAGSAMVEIAERIDELKELA